MIYDLDDLQLTSEDDEYLEELGRQTLAEGPWTTLAFLVRTRKDAEGPWEGPFLWLHRYQKVAQGWKLVSRFRTTERAQLNRLRGALEAWSDYLSDVR
jgi:lipopolysaccharide biosynthesis protein